MKEHAPRDVRNIALAGHSGAGKTSLAEALLHVAGCSERLGRVDDGTATTDFDPDETRRKISISLAMAPCEWNNRILNWVDTPGYPDFGGELVFGHVNPVPRQHRSDATRFEELAAAGRRSAGQ